MRWHIPEYIDPDVEFEFSLLRRSPSPWVPVVVMVTMLTLFMGCLLQMSSQTTTHTYEASR